MLTCPYTGRVDFGLFAGMEAGYASAFNNAVKAKDASTVLAGHSLCFRVLQDPEPVFYKDEGGKANHLVAVVCVQKVSSEGEIHDSTALGNDIYVESKLCYENGKDVEDGPEILKILSLVPKYVSTTDDRVTCKFRIEKVSRRKDGQRFRIQFSVNKDLSPVCDVLGVCTSPICVLSKRKSPASSEERITTLSPLHAYSSPIINISKRRLRLSAPSVGNRARGTSLPMTKSEIEDIDELANLRQSFNELASRVNNLSSRVAVLEKQNSFLRDKVRSLSDVDGLANFTPTMKYEVEPVRCEEDARSPKIRNFLDMQYISNKRSTMPDNSKGFSLDIADVEFLKGMDDT